MTTFSSPIPAPTTIIALDWDDTILCTSFLLKKAEEVGIKDPIHLQLSQALALRLKRLEVAIEKFLDQLQRIGTVYFVTNASSDWVVDSCARFLPAIIPYIAPAEGSKAKQLIPIISAANLYSTHTSIIKEEYTDEAGARWKYDVIRRILSYNGPGFHYLVTIGDSRAEWLAALQVKEERSKDYPPPLSVTPIKMTDHPSIEGLVEQLGLLTGCITRLINGQSKYEIRTTRCGTLIN